MLHHLQRMRQRIPTANLPDAGSGSGISSSGRFWKLSFRSLLLVLAFVAGANFAQAQTTFTIGTGTGANTNTGYPAPFGNWYWGARHQFIYTAAELQAAGMTVGTITQFGFNVTNVNGAPAHQNYSIKMKNSATTSLAAAWETGLTTVYGPVTQTPVVGWNLHTLSTPFAWDGSSNIVVEVCFNNSSYVYNASTQWTTGLSAGISRWYNTDQSGVCSSTAVSTASSTIRPNAQFVHVPASACTGTPNPGNTTSTQNPVCAGVNFTLGTQNPANGSGMSYQWQSSTDGVNWTNVSGTSASYTTSITANTWFQVITTCTNSGLTATSTPLLVNVNSFLNCYCTSAAQYIWDNEITNVTFGSLNNSSTCASTGGAGSSMNMYSNYTATVTAPDVMQGQTVPFSLNFGSCFGTWWNTAGTAIYIDYDHSGSFQASEQVYLSGSQGSAAALSGTIMIPTTALAGNTWMRVVHASGTPASITPCGTYFYGETEDYMINILQAVNCSGTPTAGTAPATLNTCPNNTVSILASGASIGTGISYQWQQSTDGGATWQPAVGGSGATTPSYTSPAITSANNNIKYRLEVSCSFSGTSATTSPTTVTLNSFLICYCPSGATTTFDGDIGNVTFGTMTNGVATPSTSNPTAVNTYTDHTSLFTPPHTFAQGNTYNISVSQITQGSFMYTSWNNVFIDYNQDGDFTDPGERVFDGGTNNGNATVSGTVTIPATATLGTTKMRVINTEGGNNATSPCATFGYGETEDYYITIITPPAYDIAPTALVAPGNAPCFSAAETVSVTVTNTGLNSIDFDLDPAAVQVTATGPNPTIFSPVPMTGILAPGASMNVVVSTTYNMSAAGNYCFSASTLYGSDENALNDVLATVCRNVIAPLPINYLETFETTADWATPTGWAFTGNSLQVQSGYGVNGSKGLTENIYQWNSTANITTPKIGPVTLTSHFIFDYRIVNYPFNAANPIATVLGPNDKIDILISEDCGVTFQPFQTIDASTHNTSNAFVEKQYSLINYLGDNLMFKFELTWGSGDYYVQIDSVEVRNLPVPPAFDLSAFSIVSPAATGCYSNNQAVTVRVMNTGSATVDFTTEPTLVGAEVDLPGGGANPVWAATPILTGTLAPGQYLDVQVATLDMTPGGTYNFKGYVMASDMVPGNDTIENVMRTVIPALPLNYLETFNAGTALPAGWNANLMYVMANHGTNGSNGITYEMWTTPATNPTATSPKVGPITANSHLIFDYRIVDWFWTGNPTSATVLSGNGAIEILISDDCGQTYDLFQTINSTNHVTSVNFAQKQYSLASYAGANIMVRFRLVYKGSGDYYTDIDNVEIRDLFPVDLGTIALVNPVSGSSSCGGSATQSVTVQLKNWGSATLDMAVNNVTITGSADNGTAQPFTTTITTGTLAPGATMDVVVGTVNMSTAGVYTFTSSATVTGDGNAANNGMAAATVTVFDNLAVTAATPYQESFETSAAGWASGGTFNSWERGTPAKTVITGAGHGTQAWVTGGTGTAPYNSDERSYVISPCYDLSGMPANAEVKMRVWWNSENSYDGTVLQYTTNGGTTWTTVGTASTPTVNNWYNNSNVWVGDIATYIGGNNWWSGSGTNGSGGWVTARRTLPAGALVNGVRFRVAFAADGIIAYDGFAFDNFIIQVPMAATISATANVSCFGAMTGQATVTATGGVGPYTYSWNTSPVQTTATATGLGAGTYTVTVTDAFGESATQTVTITQPSTALVVSVTGTTAGCSGEATATVSGGDGPYTYSWNTIPVQTTATATGLTTGTYDVTVTDANGCAVTQSVNVTTQTLNGTYTVNAGMPTNGTNFSSFNDLSNALNGCGVSGNAIVNVTLGSGPYNDQQLLLQQIPGAGPNSMVTINGNGETLSFCATSPGNRDIVRLDGTDWLRLNNLNIIGTCSQGWGIHLLNGADNVILDGNTVTVNATSPNLSMNQGIVATNSFVDPQVIGTAATNLQVLNNTVNGGYNGIRINGAEAAPSTGLVLNNNTVNNAYEYGIYVLYNNAPQIINNEVTMRAGNVRSMGYMINRIEQGITFTGNYVKNAGRRSIFLNYVNHTSTTTGLIANNMVAGGLQNQTEADGLYINYSDHLQVYHNSTVTDNSGTGYSFCVTNWGSRYIDVKNNSFAYTGNGNGYAVAVGASIMDYQQDYNNYYSNGANLGRMGNVNHPNTPAGWVSLKGAPNQWGAHDLNSMNVNPMYITNLDLKLQAGSPLINTVTPLVATDFYGTARQATTDMGAYETGTNPRVTAGQGLEATVYPNPFREELKVELSGVEGKVAVVLSDMMGREVYRNSYQVTEAGFTVRPATEIAEGVYMLQITANGITTQYRVVKQ